MDGHAPNAGLMTREEFVRKKRQRTEPLTAASTLPNRNPKDCESLPSRLPKCMLSFAEDEDESDDSPNVRPHVQGKVQGEKGFGKDPEVQTHFLPDREKEELEAELREELKREWKQKVAAEKTDQLTVTYSYFNGVGHRRKVRVQKGDRIADFLRKVQLGLEDECRELRAASSSSLMFVKEDVILPHEMTFYELISRKAQGNTGPLFHFHVEEHVGVTFDPREKPKDSHAGKVLQRDWFEKHKHMYPYSKFEPFDEEKHFPQDQQY